MGGVGRVFRSIFGGGGGSTTVVQQAPPAAILVYHLRVSIHAPRVGRDVPERRSAALRKRSAVRAVFW
jgi:hypothetical protein